MTSNSDNRILTSWKREWNDACEPCSNAVTNYRRLKKHKDIHLGRNIRVSDYQPFSDKDDDNDDDEYKPNDEDTGGAEIPQIDWLRSFSTNFVPPLPNITPSGPSATTSLYFGLPHPLTFESRTSPLILLPTSENISEILCKIDNRRDILEVRSALETLCEWVARSRVCTSRPGSSGRCLVMDEFYELAGIQRILQFLEFVLVKVKEAKYRVRRTGASFDDPFTLSKICFVLTSCSLYSREHSQKIVARGGIESLVALNEHYLDHILLSPFPAQRENKVRNLSCHSNDKFPLLEGDLRKMEWEVVHGIWEVFESLMGQQILLQIREAHDQILDASFDTMESLYGVNISHSIASHICCKVVMTLDYSLCRVSYLRQTRTINYRRIIPHCLRILRDHTLHDWRDFSSYPQNAGVEMALLKNTNQFLVNFFMLDQMQKEQHHYQKQHNSTKTLQYLKDDSNFLNVIQFAVEQIQKSPKVALKQGTFALIVGLCQNPEEKVVLRSYKGLMAALEKVVSSKGVEPTLKNACRVLLGYL